jgi:hypothetical protein
MRRSRSFDCLRELGLYERNELTPSPIDDRDALLDLDVSGHTRYSALLVFQPVELLTPGIGKTPALSVEIGSHTDALVVFLNDKTLVLGPPERSLGFCIRYAQPAGNGDRCPVRGFFVLLPLIDGGEQGESFHCVGHPMGRGGRVCTYVRTAGAETIAPGANKKEKP